MKKSKRFGAQKNLINFFLRIRIKIENVLILFRMHIFDLHRHTTELQAFTGEIPLRTDRRFRFKHSFFIFFLRCSVFEPYDAHKDGEGRRRLHMACEEQQQQQQNIHVFGEEGEGKEFFAVERFFFSPGCQLQHPPIHTYI